ncbi:hypothetical protein HDU97_009142 [Phlyctochytrium planicorne]|nr:hypothetical protein HDU97_009142 [Phlyctochytrium planicorne]
MPKRPWALRETRTPINLQSRLKEKGKIQSGGGLQVSVTQVNDVPILGASPDKLPKATCRMKPSGSGSDNDNHLTADHAIPLTA